MAHPAAALLGQALLDFARRNVDEPDEQDAVLDFLEDWVEGTATRWDDRLLLPVFRAIRLAVGIEETDPKFADDNPEVMEELTAGLKVANDKAKAGRKPNAPTVKTNAPESIA